jgi:hypothetical protein
MRAFVDRILNEPVLIVAVVLAVGNLFGQDLSSYDGFIESAIVIVGGFVARSFVSPVRSL